MTKIDFPGDEGLDRPHEALAKEPTEKKSIKTKIIVDKLII
jgi:hypothetical protein